MHVQVHEVSMENTSRCPNVKGACDHQLQPDQNKLMTSWCSLCGCCVVDQDMQKYVAVRRQVALEHCLGTAAAPLDRESFRWLSTIVGECGIDNEAKTMSVVLVEGMIPDTIANEPLCEMEEALCRNPVLTVRKVRKFRQSGTRDMIIADVELHAEVHRVRNKLAMSPNCALPQWSTHITIGTVLRNRGHSMEVLKRLKRMLSGHQLRVEPRWMKVFPPEFLGGYSQQTVEVAVSARIRKRVRPRRKFSQTQAPPVSSVTSATANINVPEIDASTPNEKASLPSTSAHNAESAKVRAHIKATSRRHSSNGMHTKSRKAPPSPSKSVGTDTTSEETSKGSLADASIDTIEPGNEFLAKLGSPARRVDPPDLSRLSI